VALSLIISEALFCPFYKQGNRLAEVEQGTQDQLVHANHNAEDALASKPAIILFYLTGFLHLSQCSFPITCLGYLNLSLLFVATLSRLRLGYTSKD
jgi:hypothetical protein